jgi:cell division septation protein DedD
MMKGVVRGAWRIGWLVWLSFFFAACTKTTPPKPTLHFLAWSQDQTTSKRLCVLPFLDRAQTPGITTQVRQSVAGHLSVKHFTDVELSEIDERLSQAGEEWRNFPPQQLGRSIGCGVLLYGEVTEASRLYLALYSQLTVAGAIRLVDVTTGQTLVQDSYTTKFREAGVPLSPFSVVPDVVKTWMNLSETQMVRAIDDLGRNLAERVPNLPVTLPSSPEQVVVASAAPAPPSMTVMPVSEEPAVSLALNSQQIATFEVATVNALPSGSPSAKKISPPLPPHPAAQGQYRLQVAAFRTYSEAQRVVRLLRDKGYPAMIAQTGESGHLWNRVVLGPFPSKEAAQQTSAAIRKISPLSPVVIPRTDY